MRSKGSIEQRGKHWFRASIVVSGKRHRQTFTTAAEAQAWLREVQSQLGTSRFDSARQAERITLSEALDRYDGHVTANYPAGRSADHRKRLKTVRKHLGGLALLDRSLSSILTRDIAAFRNSRLTSVKKNGKTVTGETVRKELSLLSRVFTVARAEWGLDTLDNPVTRGVRPGPSAPRMHRISDEHWELLLEAARKYQSSAHATVPIETVLRLALATTMRLGEIESLQWQNITLDKRTAYIPPEEDKAGDGRSVPLAPEAVALLRGLGPKPSGKVFDVEAGSIRTAWNRVRRRAGVAARFHDIRHEGISRLVENAHRYGLSDLEIMMVSGHKTPAMLKRYTHLRAANVAAKLADGSHAHLRLVRTS